MDYKKIFRNKKVRLYILNMLSIVPDKIMIEIEYFIRTGKRLSLETPQTFTEKLQWLKLYDRKRIYTFMVDKVSMKRFVAKKIGKQYVVPLLGAWDSFDDIDFDTLPDQFVLKCSHDSGSVILCEDKSKFDYNSAKEKLEFHLKISEYLLGREWPYKNVKRRIIAERFLKNNSEEKGFSIKDYKFFCFDGVPKVMYISNDRGDDPRTDFFDMEFKHLPIRMKDPNADQPPVKPERFEEMKRIAAILSKGIPHLRVDFYEVGAKLYVGELTFYHNSGYTPIEPKEWDLMLGKWIKLPQKSR